MEPERYDRQLRLWGPDGQEKLAFASVCVVGSSAVGAEVLKNLILPGIGSYCLIDDAVVSERDIAANFFLEPSDIGNDRAQAVHAKLKELNPMVKGSYAKSFEQVRTEKFDLVVACNSNFPISCPILLHVQSIGFLGRVQIFSETPHLVLEPKSEEARIDDLGILNPWFALREFADAFSFEPKSDERELFHTPWLVILIKAARQLMDAGLAFTQKNLEEAIEVLEGPRNAGRNFEEARNNIYRITALLTDQEVRNHLLSVVEMLAIEKVPDKLCAQTASGLRALLTFHEREGRFPVFGASIPDMTSTSESYTKLVDIFRTQWLADIQKLHKICPDLEKSLLLKVVANFRNIYVLQYPSMRGRDELATSPSGKRHNRGLDEIDSDQAALVELLNGNRLDAQSPLQIEFERYSDNVELHAVSSVIGSVAAQEVVKLITHQFGPLDNSFVFNGINGSAFVYRL